MQSNSMRYISIQLTQTFNYLIIIDFTFAIPKISWDYILI